MDEERISPGLGGDPVGDGIRAAGKQRLGQQRRHPGIERVHCDLIVHHPPGAIQRERLVERPETRAGGAILAPERQQEQQPRRVGWLEECAQQLGAVDVAPLQVVDGRDHQRPAPDAFEQLAQRAERATAHLARVGHEQRVPRGVGDRRYPLQHGEHTGHGRDVHRQQVIQLRHVSPQQPAGQRVHNRVDRLERNGFLLIAASRQHDDRFILLHVDQELLQQRALPRPGSSVQERRRAGPAAHTVQCLVESVEQVVPSHEQAEEARVGLGSGDRFGDPRQAVPQLGSSRSLCRDRVKHGEAQ